MNSIFHRISVRKYEDRPVEKEKIMEILRAGMQAPSACNQQPWEFYVVTDKEKIQKLSKVTPYTGCAAGAPVVIVPVYHTEGLIAPSFTQIDMADRAAEYLAGNRCPGAWRRMVWHCASRRPHGGSTQTAGSSGKCESIFHVCTGLSGRNKTSAESICAGKNTFH